MLILAGLGLYDEKDLSLREIEEAKTSDKIFIELYTSKWHGSLEQLEKILGKKVEVLSRKDLEENSEKILEIAKDKKVILFVQGDALAQTTHSSLLLEARKLNIQTKVIHNASIISAIGETGLHLQKFGPYVTIPFPERTKGKLPESVYEIIKMNKTRGLHTLCLLDVLAEEKKYMQPKEGLKILLEIEKKRKEGVISEESEVLIFSNAGSEKPLILFGKIKNLVKKDIETPAVIIVPGILHFTEKEFLLLYSEE
ncbi:MAG: diphthine synthase [Candidatus Aenigmatarchaeota archaeon]